MESRRDTARERRRMKTRRLRLSPEDAINAKSASDLQDMRFIAGECGIKVQQVYIGGATMDSMEIARMNDIARNELLMRDYLYDFNHRDPLRRAIEERQAAGIRA